MKKNPGQTDFDSIISAFRSGEPVTVDYTAKNGKRTVRPATVSEIIPGGFLIATVDAQTRRFNWAGVNGVS